MLPSPQFSAEYLASLSPSEFQAVVQPILLERLEREALLDAMVDALGGGLELQTETATAEQTVFALDTTPSLDPDDDPRVQLLINGIGSTDFTVDVGAPSLTYTGATPLGDGDQVLIFVWPEGTEGGAERFAARYIVGPAGQTGVTHNTVQTAITAAAAGVRPALIYVRAGTYYEGITLGADSIHIVGEAAYGGVTIVGAHAIDIGDQPGDAGTSHQAELRNLLLVADDPATGAVLTISGNPQRVWLRDVRIWGGTSAEDCLVLNCSGGQVALRNCHVWHSAGGTGTPIDVQAGTVRIDGGCAVDHGTAGVAIDNLAGVVWAPGADLRVTGQIRNQAANGAGGFAVFISGLAITTNNTEAIICDGSGIVQLGLVGSICAGVQPLATGGGGFAYTSDQAVLIGHTAPAVTLNGGAGASDLRSIGAAGILATLAGYGDLVTVNRADLREVPAGGVDGQLLTAQGGGAYGWEDAAGGGGGATAPSPTSTPTLSVVPDTSLDEGEGGSIALVSSGSDLQLWRDGGVPVVRFPGAAAGHLNLGTAAGSPSSWTVIVAVKPRSAAIYRVAGVSVGAGTSDDTWGVVRIEADGSLISTYGDGTNATVSYSDSTPVTFGAWNVIGITYADGDTGVQMWHDGVEQGVTLGAANADSSGPAVGDFLYGRQGSAVSSNPFAGLGGILWVWDSDIGDANVVANSNALMAHYGIA